jgi:ABC-type transport system substrate-binding protein
MKKTSILTTAIFAALLLVSVYVALPAVKASPRSDLDIRFYGSQDAAYAALKSGEVDFIQWSLTYPQRLDAESDVNLAVAGYTENGMDEFDINNNYTMPTYPGVKNPLNDMWFRRAISCMTDKDYIVDTILQGAAGVLNVPIALNSLSWWPDSCLPGNYPWSYNMTKAAECLVSAGFTDTDHDGILNYPVGWPGRADGRNMDPLIFYVRTEDLRLDAGRYLAGQLDLFGIPYTKIEGTSDVCFPPVMHQFDYHLYTGGWSLGRYPTSLFSLFNSQYYYSGGSNYVTGYNADGLPNYPDYDTLSRLVYYTDSIANSQAAAKTAADLGWAYYVFNVPLWSYKSYVAWRKTMPAVVNEFGYGYDNTYQYLNAYNTAGATITMGTIAAPKSLNPLYAQWYYDYAVLSRMYEGVMDVNPYDLATDQPTAAQDWEVGTWIDPNPGPGEPSTKSTVTYYLRKDVGIVAPNGTFMRYLNAYDIQFSCWYTYAFTDGWNWADYQDVHHTEVIDQYTIKFYFDDASYWFYSAPQFPLFARNELINTLCTQTTQNIVISGNGTTGVTHWLDLPTIVEVTGTTLPVSYRIVAGYETYRHTGIVFDSVPADGTYTLTYYTTSLDPHGFYLGGLNFAQTMYSFGPFYPIAIVQGVGGYASFNRNPYYWLQTPPLGETDWRWIWDTPGGIAGWLNPGRDSGHFQIQIYDVVKATASYCHSGTGPYDTQYFPGADLDSSDLGHVGIFDVVSITGKYGLSFGAPPP